MKALCLRQPWASMVARGSKTIETRVWKTKYRGDLLITASRNPRIEGLPTGVALAIVRLVDCRPMTENDEKAACCELYDGAWAWVLSDIRLIKPIPVKGQLGLFEVQLPSESLLYYFEKSDSEKGWFTCQGCGFAFYDPHLPTTVDVGSMKILCEDCR